MAAMIELFDSAMQFKMPSDEAVAALSPEQRELFKSVQEADARLTAAIAHKNTVTERIKQNMAARQAVDVELKKLRPTWTAIDEAKAMIRANQDRAEVERGY